MKRISSLLIIGFLFFSVFSNFITHVDAEAGGYVCYNHYPYLTFGSQEELDAHVSTVHGGWLEYNLRFAFGLHEWNVFDKVGQVLRGQHIVGDELGTERIPAQPQIGPYEGFAPWSGEVFVINPYSDKIVALVGFNQFGDHMQTVWLSPKGTPGDGQWFDDLNKWMVELHFSALEIDIPISLSLVSEFDLKYNPTDVLEASIQEEAGKYIDTHVYVTITENIALVSKVKVKFTIHGISSVTEVEEMTEKSAPTTYYHRIESWSHVASTFAADALTKWLASSIMSALQIPGNVMLPITFVPPPYTLDEIIVVDVYGGEHIYPYDITLRTTKDAVESDPEGVYELWFSPVDILVTDSDGRRVGSIYEIQDGTPILIEEVNEIPRAFYNRDAELVYLPGNISSYNVTIIGLDMGNYTLASLAVRGNNGSEVESTTDSSTGSIHNFTAAVSENGGISFSPSSSQNFSQNGDLILNGTTTFRVENLNFTVTGNIHVGNSASLILHNSSLNINGSVFANGSVEAINSIIVGTSEANYSDIFIFSDYNKLAGNTLTGNISGILLLNGANNNITKNLITNTLFGIKLYLSSFNYIGFNSIVHTGSENGIILENSHNNTILGNEISNRKYGIKIFDSYDNRISGNNITRGVPLDTQPHWNKTYGGTNDDNAHYVVQTSDGGYAIAGYTYSFGASNGDFWLVKTDSAGNMEWNKTYGGIDYDIANSVVQTSDGGYAIAGYTYSFGDDSSDLWLVKTDANGNMEWNKTYGGTREDFSDGGLVQTSDGGYALAGFTYSFSVESSDFWLVKTDSSGNHQWNKTYGDGSYDDCRAMIQTADGGYALAGQTGGGSAWEKDAWLVKTDSSGNHQWNKTYGGTNYDYLSSLVQVSDEGYVLAGATKSFGGGNRDFWLVKTDSAGNMEWNKTYGGIDYDAANSMVQTNDGGYILAGSTLSFGVGSSDGWLIKTDSSGHMQWNQTCGGGGSDYGCSVVQTTGEGYAMVGYTDSYGAGNYDFWLVKIAPPAIVGISLLRSSDNIILHNNFVGQDVCVSSIESVNVWDDGYPSGGNYWSDYAGNDTYSGSYQNETDSDGVGDTPYLIDGSNQDNYPLMNPWSPIIGDVNADGIVDIFDIGFISAHWHPGPPIGPLGYHAIADINNDFAVDIMDIGIVSAHWGET